MSDRGDRSQRRTSGVSAAYRPDKTPTTSSDDGSRWRLLTFLVIVGAIFGYAGYAELTAEPFDAETAEAAAIETVNDARATEGMSRLEAGDELRAYTDDWSKEMADSGYRHGSAMCSPGGENIAYMKNSAFSSAEIGETIGQQWLDSPEHRKNIMDSRWDQQAVGIVKRGDDIYATQQFC